MKSYQIALIPGDGVGIEITDEAVRVLDAAADIHGFEVATESFDWSCDRYLETGAMMPDNALETLGEFDSIFLGCIGDADKVEDHISLAMLLTIRKGFDQYVNLRPIKLYPGVSSPIATASPETVDILVIRENTEGEYSSNGGFFKRGTPDAFALQTGIFTWKGCERAIRYAFEAARKRQKLGSTAPVGRVTNCTKSNALNYSMVFWDEAYDFVAQDYPDIETDMALVDALKANGEIVAALIDGEEATGSGRSIRGINLHDFFARWRNELPRFGGHAQAIGLSVRNEGPLLPPKTDVFQSMVSGRQGRQDEPHLGLGLYLVRLISEFHGGSVAARNCSAPDGVKVTMVLPRRP